MTTILAVITFAAVYAWAVGHKLAIMWVTQVCIERLPPPDATSGKVYTYIYGILQLAAANTRRSWDAATTARAPKP